jgi:hypothetical protein
MTVMPIPRIALAVALAAVAAALCAGCGSSSEQSATEKWADGFCSAIVTWQDDLTSIGTDLKSGGVPTKATVESAAQQAEDSTQTLADSLSSLGKPDTQAGADAQAAVTQLQGDISDGAASIKTTTADISGLSQALTAASAVSATLATMASQVSTAVTTLTQLDPKGELDDAFSQSSSCQSLKKS